MSSRNLDLGLAANNGVTVLPDVTVLPTVNQVLAVSQVAGTTVRTAFVNPPPASGMLPLAGGTMTGPITLVGNATLPLHAVPLQQLSAAIPPVMVASGIVADGATDNTIALQAAINTAQTSNTNPFATTLLLPKGRILTGPLTISGQIVIEGVHDNSTVLVLKDGSTAACITISPTGTAPNPGDARRTLTMRNLRIENQTWYTGNAAAHGINLTAAGAWQCHITLSQVTVYGMPGSGINAVAFLGWVELYDCSLFHNGLYGADCNSCFDWKWFGGDIAQNGIAGARISGCGSMVWSGTNCYSNALYNLQLFSAVGSYSGNHRFSNCNFDRSNQVGVYYDVRDVMGVVFDGCTFTNCSTVTPNTYSDVLITSSANNLAVFAACVWGNNNANDASYQEKWALEFQGTTQTVVLDGNNIYWGGTHRTNGPTQIFLNGAGGHNILQGPIGIVATSQYTGLNISNGTNVLASIGGFSGTNDNGVFSLASAGTSIIQLSATSAVPSYFNSDLWMGNGSASATPVGRALRATDASGANIGGGTLVVAPGRGTGTANPGTVSFRFAPPGTTGSTLNTEVERFSLGYSGARLTVTQQYTGFVVANATNQILSVAGFTASADGGVMSLYNGGTAFIQFSTSSGFAPTFINQILYIGNGATSATPSAQSIKATGGSGTDIAGASLNLHGGISTGAGLGGSVVIGTSSAGTTGAGANAISLRMMIDGPGNVVIGPAALATTASNGFLYIPTCAGTPTGAPTAYAGRAPILFDTTGNKLWVYNGSWKGVVVA